MKNFLLEAEQKLEKIELLTEFIGTNPDGRELKRALAVKMALENKPYAEIGKSLGISKSYITQYNHRFEAQGIAGIKLGYQGAKSYLKPAQRAEVMTWLQTKNYWDLEELVNYIDQQYGVIYQSKQSYYQLFSEAGISWKKSQKKNPQFNPELVKKNEKRFKSLSSIIRLRSIRRS
jgi:putative transposase